MLTPTVQYSVYSMELMGEMKYLPWTSDPGGSVRLMYGIL
jgi:hypothetical protein